MGAEEVVLMKQSLGPALNTDFRKGCTEIWLKGNESKAYRYLVTANLLK